MPNGKKYTVKQGRDKMTAVWFFAVLTAVLTYMVMRNVKMYGDDYFYATFTQNGWSGYLSANRDHYLLSNGRAMVHALDAVGLMLPPAVWQVFNALLLGSIVFLGVRLACSDRFGCGFFEGFCGAAVLTSVILYMNIRLTNQSVYWQTGSWNYVFPVVLLLICWCLLSRRRAGKGNAVLLSLTALLSAATTEQNAMMTIGIFVLYLLDQKLVRKEKADWAVLTALIFAFIGAATVLAAPSQWSRYADEQQKLTEMTTPQLILFNGKQIFSDLFVSDYMRPYQLMFLASIVIFVVSVSRGMRLGWNIFFKFYALCGILVMGIVLWASYLDAPNLRPYLLPIGIMAFYELVGAILLFWYLLLRRPDGYLVPLTAIVLAAGSQGMMLISPMLGPRTVLCAIFLIGIVAAYVVMRFLPLKKGKSETKVLLAMLSLVMLAHAFLVFLPTVQGYQANAPIDAQNRAQIQAFLESGGDTLIQYKMKDDDYGWSFPYVSTYHQNWYKRYYKLPFDLEIRWEETK